MIEEKRVAAGQESAEDRAKIAEAGEACESEGANIVEGAEGADEANEADEGDEVDEADEVELPLYHLVIERAQQHDILSRAAQLAYYQLFSLFPTLILIAILFSALPLPDLSGNLLEYFSGVLPQQAYSLIRTTLAQATEHRPSELLSISLLALIWASSTGMEALINSLNIAYQAEASRGWWRERLMAILLTLGLSTFILLALLIVFFGETIIKLLAQYYGLGSTFKTIWQTAQWPVAAAFVLFGLDLVYYFAPNIRQRWRWVTPGATIALVCWLSISFGLKIYVSRFSDYNVTYGVLGSFMILMLWLYLTSVAILLGGVINGAKNSMVKRRAEAASDPTMIR